MGCVLIIEEDPDLSALFALLLGSEGLECVAVRDIQGAPLALSGRRVSLVVAELASDVSGNAPLSAWRRQLRELAPTAPAILCTTVSSLSRLSAAVAGFEGYLAMPFDLDEAYAEIARSLSLRAAANCH